MRPTTAQLPRLCQRRRCSSSAISTKFYTGRGLCPRGKKDQTVLSLPAGRLSPRNQEGVPRNWGTGGKVTMSARSAQALIGAVPRRFFRPFLIAQKGTSSPRPAGRNFSQIKKPWLPLTARIFLLNPDRIRTSKSVPFRREWCTHTPPRRP